MHVYIDSEYPASQNTTLVRPRQILCLKRCVKQLDKHTDVKSPESLVQTHGKRGDTVKNKVANKVICLLSMSTHLSTLILLQSLIYWL